VSHSLIVETAIFLKTNERRKIHIHVEENFLTAWDCLFRLWVWQYLYYKQVNSTLFLFVYLLIGLESITSKTIMEKEITETNDFSSFTQYGQLILNCTEKEIKTRFESNLISTLPCIQSDRESIILEIRLENSTLTCLFDDEVCHTGLLFLDNLNYIENYVEICNEKCKLINLNSWEYLNYYIRLNFYDLDSYFSFSLSPHVNDFCF
jgi:hypothetical protein